MNKEDFFNKIYYDCQNDFEKVMSLLLARGFLIDSVSQKYFISDNSHACDFIYLNEILIKYRIGKVVENEILVTNPCDYIQLEKEFEIDSRIIWEVCSRDYGWDYFKHRYHGHKVTVKCLEPFIAYYVKAVSSTGILLDGSCDGNHQHSTKASFNLVI